jgi:hypothetical protein
LDFNYCKNLYIDIYYSSIYWRKEFIQIW